MSDEQRAREREVLCMCGERMAQIAYQRTDYRWACPQADNQNYPLHVPLPLPDLVPKPSSIRSECCSAEIRYRYCAKCGQECRITAAPSIFDAIKVVENCEYENVAVDVILQRLKGLAPMAQPTAAEIHIAGQSSAADTPYAVAEFVERVWALTQDRDGWSRTTLKGLTERLIRGLKSE